MHACVPEWYEQRMHGACMHAFVLPNVSVATKTFGVPEWYEQRMHGACMHAFVPPNFSVATKTFGPRLFENLRSSS
jgi:hypothetical protein